MQIEVLPVPYDKLCKKENIETSENILKRVLESRIVQQKRYASIEGVYCNSQISNKQMNNYCDLDNKGENILKVAIEKLNLSARSYIRIKKVSRTIADLEGSENIKAEHVAEAVQYRSLDRMDNLS